MIVNISLILSKLVFFMSSDAQEDRHELPSFNSVYNDLHHVNKETSDVLQTRCC